LKIEGICIRNVYIAFVVLIFRIKEPRGGAKEEVPKRSSGGVGQLSSLAGQLSSLAGQLSCPTH
jgi:hypothetical protein